MSKATNTHMGQFMFSHRFWSQGPRFLLLVISVLALALATGCEEPAAPEGEGESPAIRLDPVAGGPGTLLRINGVPGADNFDNSFNVTIDSVVQRATLSESGDLIVFVPALGPEDAAWPEAPAEAVDVTISRNGTEVAFLPASFTVLDLEPRPDALDEMAASLEQLHESILATLAQLGTAAEPDAWDAHVGGFEAAFAALFDPENELSLAFKIAQLTDDEKTFVGSVLANSPVGDRARDLQQALASAKSGTFPFSPMPKREIKQIDDTDLARSMQTAAVFQATTGDFHQAGAAIVAEANSVAAAFGMSRVISRFRVIAIIAGAVNGYFSIYDIFLNDFLIPMMPSVVDDILLLLEETTLQSGDEVSAAVELFALNQPSAVSLNQIVNVILDVLGAIAGGFGGPNAFLFDFQELIAHIFTEFQRHFTNFSADHPDSQIDIDVVRVPLRIWQTTVDNPVLLDLLSGDADIIDRTSEDVLTWTADGRGRTNLVATPSADPDAIFFPTLADIGGIQLSAFGTDRPPSNGVEVTVQQMIDLIVEFPEFLAESEPTALILQAVFVALDATETPAAGIDLDLTVVGGTIEHSSGVTNELGEFETIATLAPGESRLTIAITASGEFGSNVQTTVTAIRELSPIEFSGLYSGTLVQHDFQCTPDCLNTLDVEVTIGPGQNSRLTIFHVGVHNSGEPFRVLVLNGEYDVTFDVEGNFTGDSLRLNIFGNPIRTIGGSVSSGGLSGVTETVGDPTGPENLNATRIGNFP